MVRRELRSSALGWFALAALGVACAGRSSERTVPGDSTGGTTGGTVSTGGKGSGATGGKGGSGATGGKGGSGALGGSGGVGGTLSVGGAAPRGGTGGVSGEGGGAGPFPMSGAGGVSGTSGGGGDGNVSGMPAGAAGDAGAPSNQSPCKNPRPWSKNAIACDDGFIHRPAATACKLPARENGGGGAPNAEGGAGGVNSAGCSTDADCGASQYCVKDDTQPNSHTNRCVDACERDADCGVNDLCLCAPTVRAGGATVELGTCVFAGCRVDAECGADFLCTAYPPLDWRGFNCQGPADQCGSASDCEWANFFCAFQDGLYLCTY